MNVCGDECPSIVLQLSRCCGYDGCQREMPQGSSSGISHSLIETVLVVHCSLPRPCSNPTHALMLDGPLHSQPCVEEDSWKRRRRRENGRNKKEPEEEEECDLLLPVPVPVWLPGCSPYQSLPTIHWSYTIPPFLPLKWWWIDLTQRKWLLNAHIFWLYIGEGWGLSYVFHVCCCCVFET